jgi:prolyl-tRNA synthetase
MPNGKSLQSCTSHDLGQNFSKSFDWTVQGKNGEKIYPHQNSWGFSTRSIGGLIMAHGDSNGLVLPPMVAPTQVIIVPIPAHQNALDTANKIYSDLKVDYRVELDTREGESAGFKFNKWELKGIPIRIEIGDKDVAAGTVIVYRRDTGEKMTVAMTDIKKTVVTLTKDIQNSLFQKHRQYTQDHTFTVDNYDQFKEVMKTSRGFISTHWCENPECEAKIKTDTKATTRCLPLDAPEESGQCVACGSNSTHRWLFGLSY